MLSDERLGLSLMNMLVLCQVYVSHIYVEHVIENACLYIIYEASVTKLLATLSLPVLVI
jgi:hypothetical protein